MIQIRRNVFETNSSSSHSISIMKKSHYVTHDELLEEFKWDIRDGVCKFYRDELTFGRSPFEVLTTFKEKLRFAFASYNLKDYDRDIEMREEIISLVYELLPELKEITFEQDRSYDFEKGCYRNGVEYFYGDIDHQSVGLLENFLVRNNISIREFLTNSKYIVFIDGDEYQIKEKLFETGLFHKEDFENIKAGQSDDEMAWERYEEEHKNAQD